MKFSKRFLPILAWFGISAVGIQLANWAARYHYTWNLVALFTFLLGGLVGTELDAKLGFEHPAANSVEEAARGG